MELRKLERGWLLGREGGVGRDEGWADVVDDLLYCQCCNHSEG